MPPVFDATKCKKCRKCVTRCPGYLLEMGEKKNRKCVFRTNAGTAAAAVSPANTKQSALNFLFTQEFEACKQNADTYPAR